MKNEISESDWIPYRPMESREHIRLLHLFPALHPDQPLECSLQHKNLQDAVDVYEAVSYTWGRPVFSHKLIVNGEGQLGITKNLDTLLRQFRDGARTRLLWVDAVCINQKDDREKSTQIPLMAQIFRFASGVLAWLGEGGIEEGAIPLIHRLSRFLPAQTESFSILSSVGSLDRACLTSTGSRDVLESFLELPWFRRRWIIQEVVMNAEVHLHYGQHRISWLRFMSILEQMTMNGCSRLHLHNLSPITQVFRLWQQWSHCPVPDDSKYSGTKDLMYYLKHFDHFKCSNPKDMIYALLAFAEVARSESYLTGEIHSRLTHDIPFNIDYSQSLLCCYTTFASSAISKGHFSSILDQVCGRKYQPTDLDIPSWVPDWQVAFVGGDRPPGCRPYDARDINGTALTIEILSTPLYDVQASPATKAKFATIMSKVLLPAGLPLKAKNLLVREFLTTNLNPEFEEGAVFFDCSRPRKVGKALEFKFALTSFGPRTQLITYRTLRGKENLTEKVAIEESLRRREVCSELNFLNGERSLFLAHVSPVPDCAVPFRVYHLGLGPSTVDLGDRIVGFPRPFSLEYGSAFEYASLIVRPVCQLTHESNSPPTYRLLGSTTLKTIVVPASNSDTTSLAERIGQSLCNEPEDQKMVFQLV